MTGHDILIRDSAEHYGCAPGTSLLAAMESLGRRGIPVGCRNGGCGVCRVRIESGPYHCGPMSRAVVTEQDRADGIVLACRTYPLGPVELSVLGRMARAFGSGGAGATRFDFSYGRGGAAAHAGPPDNHRPDPALPARTDDPA